MVQQNNSARQEEKKFTRWVHFAELLHSFIYFASICGIQYRKQYLNSRKTVYKNVTNGDADREKCLDGCCVAARLPVFLPVFQDIGKIGTLDNRK